MNFTKAFCPIKQISLLRNPDYYTWGGSMVRDANETCHLFYSRWPKATGFNSWVVCSEIAHAVATDPLGPYRHQNAALPARGAKFWDGLCTHNPTVQCFDGKYYLYYMGNTGDGKPVQDQTDFNWLHRNNQRIGVAVADHPSGPWTRFEVPLIDVSSQTSAPDSLMIANPSVVRRPEGDFLMIYKAVGRENPLPFGGPVIHLAARSDRPDGPFEKLPNKFFCCEGAAFPFEDPFVWHQDDAYYAILKDMDCYTQPTIRSLVLFKSDDGVDWSLAENSLVSDRTVRFEDGSVKTFDYLERPQMYLENGQPCVLFCAARNGEETLNIHIPLEIQ